MISFKCKVCNGEVSVDGQGILTCEYCGNKISFSDSDFTEYRNFRLKMLNYLRGVNDKETNQLESIWKNADSVAYKSVDGTDINISYIYSSKCDDVLFYVAKNSVIFVFEENQRNKAIAYEDSIKLLEYPPADVKDLNRCFPEVIGRFELSDNKYMLALSRRDNVFPLSLFGSIKPVHVAWIISRLENICCVLEFSDLSHGGIEAEAVYIDPFTHEAVLYGGWWNTAKKPGGDIEDLKALRKTANYIMGIEKSESPVELTEFLSSAPQGDAFADFEAWDKVIEKGFGGRKFVKMKVDI